jgi:hypothetical protein
MNHKDVEPWDEVKISGRCFSEDTDMVDVVGTVATVDHEEDSIKVWPHAEIGDGKLWFVLSTSSITLLHRPCV